MNQEKINKYQDLYRKLWEIQSKLDNKINPTLKKRQKPIKSVGGSKEGGAKGGRSNRPRPFVSLS